MARQPFPPGKRRTRQHVIADLSVNHVERLVLLEGHAVNRIVPDYGYDLSIVTFDEAGYAENGLILVQLKATDSLKAVGEGFAFDVDIRDHNLWTREQFPVILILYDAAVGRGYWVHIQDYFRDRRPKSGAKTVRILVPRRQPLTRRSIGRLRAIRDAKTVRLAEEFPDD